MDPTPDTSHVARRRPPAQVIANPLGRHDSMTLSRAFWGAWVTLAVCVFFAALLAQATGWEQPGVAGVIGRLIGHGALGAGMMLLVHTPLLLTLRRLARVGPILGAALGAAIPLAGLLVISNPTAETWGEKFTETLETCVNGPELFASEWLPLMIAGAVFGYLSSSDNRAAA